MLRLAPLLIITVVLCLPGCDLVEETVASGSCQGRVGTTAVDGPLAAGSEFHRDDGHLGTEAAFLNLSAASGKLSIAAHLADMPGETRVGAHALVPLTGFVDAWVLVTPAEAPELASGSLTLTAATRESIAGSFEMVFVDGSSASCEFTIPRDYGLDTDD